jgi:hypothetical protein
MRIIALALGLFWFINGSTAQQLKKYPIGNSGASTYMYCDPKKFDFDYSTDSSSVYTGQCQVSEVTYGIILIKLLHPIEDLEDAEEVMVSYLDFMKVDFHVKRSAGYGKGHQLNKDPDTRGILDYWTDTEEQKWKVKSWTNGKMIGVLFAYSMIELPEPRVNIFLEGLRFPGMK